MLTLYESLKRNENINVNALYFENKSYTFKEVVKNVEKMVTYLQNKGIKENDVVTVVLPNVPVTIYLFYALNAIGAIQNIVHPLTPAKQIIKTMEETNSKHAMVLATIYQEEKELFDNSSYKFFFVNPVYDQSFT